MARLNKHPADPLIGKQLAGRFEIMNRIGEGGMGVVYKAKQISVDRIVAIKVLNAEAASDPTWVQRFINEARACSKLQHPNTIRLIDFGQADAEGVLYIAMEFLDGKALSAVLQAERQLAPPRVLKIASQVCQSLTEAHAFGIIHRDLKPDNLFLLNFMGAADFVKVLDFSVAKLRQQSNAAQTQAGVVFGTPQYMSPEQGRGLPLDARSDIYALGIVMYEMLAGRPPFMSQNPMEVLGMHVQKPPPPLLGIPDRVANLVIKTLAKEPARRHQTTQELQQDCELALAELMAGGMHAPMPMAAPAGPAPAKTLFMDAQAEPVDAGPQPQKTMIAMGPGLPGGLGMDEPTRLPPGEDDAPKKTLMFDSPEMAGALGPVAAPTPMPMASPMPVPSMRTPVPLAAGAPTATAPAQPEPPEEVEEIVPVPAPPLFWFLSILGGITVGFLLYLIVAAIAG